MLKHILRSIAGGPDEPGRKRLMRFAATFALLLVLLGAGGFLVAASGIVPIKASSGHWAITRWILQFAKQRSVAMHSLAVEAPPLDEPWLVLKGAGHYEIGCRPCHGSPDYQHPRIAQRMTPAPPYLPLTIPQWEREELFYMVKHGIKFTGMPAWPAQQRDDEVWAVVAFLRAFPELDEEAYRRLVNGEQNPARETVPLAALEGTTAAARTIIPNCARCHGADGLGRGSSAFPKLAGQREEYTTASLEAYALGKRQSGMMGPIAASLGTQEMREVSRYYASRQPAVPVPSAAAEASEPGERIARLGIPAQEVPACADCHGPGDSPRKELYPRLAGQHAAYLALQLSLFKQVTRGGTAYAHLMHNVAAGLNSQQMEEVAKYYAALEEDLSARPSTEAASARPE